MSKSTRSFPLLIDPVEDRFDIVLLGLAEKVIHGAVMLFL